MTEIILLRHAESVKNIVDVIGGPGARLTENGRTQSRDIASEGGGCISRATAIIHSSNVQCVETAEIVGSIIRVVPTVCAALEPLDLGVLSNCSVSDAKERHAKSFASLQEWNAGLIGIDEVSIDGMEDLAGFFARGYDILDWARKQHGSVLVIATRSMLILLANILSGAVDRPNGYRHIEFLNCVPVIFEIT